MQKFAIATLATVALGKSIKQQATNILSDHLSEDATDFVSDLTVDASNVLAAHGFATPQ